jgi:ubiquinol-cytochrome c reductase cytochrome b subunit
MFTSILILLILPLLDNSNFIRGTKFMIFYQGLFWFFIIVVCCLGWLGAQPAEPPFILISQITTCCYFIFFILVYDLGYLESAIVKANN